MNSLGNLGGFFGPFVGGWLKQASGGYRVALVVLGACLAVNGVTIVVLHLAGMRTARLVPTKA